MIFHDFDDLINFYQIQCCGRRWRNSLQHPCQSQYPSPQPYGESHTFESGPGMRQEGQEALQLSDCRSVLQKLHKVRLQTDNHIN